MRRLTRKFRRPAQPIQLTAADLAAPIVPATLSPDALRLLGSEIERVGTYVRTLRGGVDRLDPAELADESLPGIEAALAAARDAVAAATRLLRALPPPPEGSDPIPVRDVAAALDAAGSNLDTGLGDLRAVRARLGRFAAELPRADRRFPDPGGVDDGSAADPSTTRLLGFDRRRNA